MPRPYRTESDLIQWAFTTGKIKVVNACWLWTGHLDKDGYALDRVDRVTKRIHRVFYRLLKGEIKKGLQIDHLCRIRNCVNPDHLEPVTPKENVIRGELANLRRMSGGTHCKKGHPFTYSKIKPNGWVQRTCKPCTNKRQRDAYAKKISARRNQANP